MDDVIGTGLERGVNREVAEIEEERFGVGNGNVGSLFQETHGGLGGFVGGVFLAEVARRHADDENASYDIKDPVYDLIWGAAQEWAGYSRWQPA